MMTKYQHGSGNEMTSPLRLCSSTQEAAIALEKSPLKTCWGLPKGSTFSSLYCLGCFQYSAYFKVKNQPTPAGQVMINKQRRENRKSGFKWQRGTCQSSSWVTGGQNSEGGGGKMERERESRRNSRASSHIHNSSLSLSQLVWPNKDIKQGHTGYIFALPGNMDKQNSEHNSTQHVGVFYFIIILLADSHRARC